MYIKLDPAKHTILDADTEDKKVLLSPREVLVTEQKDGFCFYEHGSIGQFKRKVRSSQITISDICYK